VTDSLGAIRLDIDRLDLGNEIGDAVVEGAEDTADRFDLLSDEKN
jgi:hypothetical protein